MILSCSSCALAKGDYTTWVSKRARLLQRQLIAQDTVEFVFTTESPLTFRPGQFVSIQVGMDAQQNPILRSYSIAAGPWETNPLTLVVRKVEGGPGSQFFETLQPGDWVHFTGPMGFFINELQHPGDVIYAVTGTGLAPIYPMLQETLQRQDTGQIHLFWGVRYKEDLFYQEKIATLAQQHPRLQIHIYVSRPSEDHRGLKGRIIQPILQELPSWKHPLFYLCGNGAMIQELKALLQAQGIERKKQIRTEAFFE